MKAFSQIFVTMGFVAVLLIDSRAQGPCLLLGAAESSCPGPASSPGFSNNLVDFRLADITAGLDMAVPAGVEPRYKAFWIFGDGNFKHHPSNLEPAGDLLTLREDDYGFPPIGADYITEVVLTEKKSNTTPPPAIHREVSIPQLSLKEGPTYATPAPFRYQIYGPKTMDIFNSELNRPFYPTAFVVSAPKNDPQINKMMFFFNSMRIGETGSFGRGIIHDPVNDFSIRLPNFLEPQTPAIIETTTLPGSNYSTEFQNGVSNFLHFIEVDVPATSRSNMPSGFTEIRFFPVLKTAWDEVWVQDNDNDGKPDNPLPYARYLSLSLGPEPLYTANDSTDSPEFNTFSSQVKEIFGASFALPFQVSSDPTLYLRGIDTLDVRMVASIDPNGIQVLSVCPTGKDRYQVRLKLEVCNEGYMPESDIKFYLTDHSKLLSAPNFSANPLITTLPYIPNQYHWGYDWNIHLEAVPNPEEPKPAVHPKTCEQTEFMVETNWAGVQALIDGKALQLCVKFSLGKPVCTFNSPVSSREYCPDAGYRCGDCPKTVSPEYCCNWIFYGLILLILILLALFWIVWYLLRRKKKH